MKKITLHICIVLIGILTILSCEQEETMMYDTDRASINFSGSLAQYSFLKTGLLTDTVKIPFTINGMAFDMDRSATLEVVVDSTNAVAADYEILSKTVKAGEFNGLLLVKVNRPQGDTFDDRRVYFRVVDGDDFLVGLPSRTDYELQLTNKLTPAYRWTPTGWKSKYFLGSYSTAYYKFLMEATGETEYPYPWAVPGYNNDQKWNSAEKNAFIAKAKAELKKYNESIAPDVLLHDDGLAEGQPVVIGKYYAN